jgi:TonB family protein
MARNDRVTDFRNTYQQGIFYDQRRFHPHPAALFATGMTFITFSSAQAETNADYRASVEKSIDAQLRMPEAGLAGRHGTATLAVVVDASGRVESIKLLKSAGFANFDREAIRTASRVSYPASANGRTVAMVLGFNEAVTSKAQARRRRDRDRLG